MTPASATTSAIGRTEWGEAFATVADIAGLQVDAKR